MSTYLLIDDEPDLVDVYAGYLQRKGHNVLTANDAQTGLDMLDNNDIDAVVLDVFMPEHNGLTVLQYLQSYDDWQQIPVVLMTSVKRNEFNLDDTQLKQHGVAKYVDKSSATPRQLLKTLETLGSHEPHSN